MGKSTFIVFLALAMLKIQAQDYFIGFAGKGATTEIGTIKVDNLTSGATLTLNGGDILHLKPAVGIVSLDIANGALRIYPNPMTEESMLTFITPESGHAVICLVDLSGKTVYQISILLSPGAHSFRVSGLNQGMYFVKVTGKNYTCSTKLISQSNLQRQAVIEYVSSENNTPGGPLKSVEATIDMPYKNGDQLLFKGISGIYSTIVTDVPASSKTITFNFVACTDNEGNNYTIVEIGARIWMAENLNVGRRITASFDQTNNSIIEKYCYDDNETNCNTYGGLYQWDESMQYSATPGVEGICPTGWHLPTDGEWTTLTTYLGGESIAGGKMKSPGTIEAGTGLWLSPNTGATNSSGFTALAGGRRYISGYTDLLYTNDYFWSSSQHDATYAWYRFLYYNYEYVLRYIYYKTCGFSVRCVQDWKWN
jgi:uncharacterized protein (TIGR02145 family)